MTMPQSEQGAQKAEKRKHALEAAGQAKSGTNNQPKFEDESPKRKIKGQDEDDIFAVKFQPFWRSPQLEELMQQVEFTGLKYRDAWHKPKRTRTIEELALDAYIKLDGDRSQLVSLTESVAIHCEPCDLQDFTRKLDNVSFYDRLSTSQSDTMQQPQPKAEVVPKPEFVPDNIEEAAQHLGDNVFEVEYPAEVVFTGKRKPDKKRRRPKPYAPSLPYLCRPPVEPSPAPVQQQQATPEEGKAKEAKSYRGAAGWPGAAKKPKVQELQLETIKDSSQPGEMDPRPTAKKAPLRRGPPKKKVPAVLRPIPRTRP